jgi:hypothetical protein
LIEERDRKKLDATSANPFSSTCIVSFTQTNPHISGASVGGTSMLNPSAQSVNHFHSRTTIEGSAPTFGMPQQTMAILFGQGYMQTAPSFPMPNFTSALYTSGGNNRVYTHAIGNYQAPYTTIGSLSFLTNHAYQNTLQFNGYGQPKADNFGYETPPQFPFRPQLIDMMPP